MFAYNFQGCSFAVINPDTMEPFEMFEAYSDCAKNGVMQVKMPASAPFVIEVKSEKDARYQFFESRVLINGKTVRLADGYFRRQVIRGHDGSDQHLFFSSVSDTARKSMGETKDYNETTVQIDVVKAPIFDESIPLTTNVIEHEPQWARKAPLSSYDGLAGGMICTRMGRPIETKIAPYGDRFWKCTHGEEIKDKHVKVMLQLVRTASDEEKTKTVTSDGADVRMDEEVVQLEKEFLAQAKVVDLCNLRLARIDSELERAQATANSIVQEHREALKARNEAALQAKYLKERLDARRTGKPVGNVRHDPYLINWFPF